MIKAKIRKPFLLQANRPSLYMTMTGFLEKDKEYIVFKRVNETGEMEIVIREWKFDPEITGLYRTGIIEKMGEDSEAKDMALKESEEDDKPDAILLDNKETKELTQVTLKDLGNEIMYG